MRRLTLWNMVNPWSYLISDAVSITETAVQRHLHYWPAYT